MDFEIWFDKGGALIWVLAGVFVLGLAVAIERLLYFFFSSFRTEDLEMELSQDMDGQVGIPGDLADRMAERVQQTRGRSSYIQALGRIQMANSPIIRMARIFVAAAADRRESRELRLERTGAELIAEMQRRTGLLAIIGAVAPFLGLLGTVTGMMHSFQEIASAAGQADMGALAAGIWEAMITTAAGLVVAIFALLAHGWFTGRVNRRIRAMNALVAMLEEKLYSNEADDFNGKGNVERSRKATSVALGGGG